MRILWVGDATVSSGFARCTHAACDALHAAGHEVHVLGLNYYGDPHGYPYPIWPCFNPLDDSRDYYGVDRLPTLANRIDPHVIVLLTDPWNVRQYVKMLQQRWPDGKPLPFLVGWLAVDAENQPGEELNVLDHVIVWTEFAKVELERSGCDRPIDVVPLGVDGSVFYPEDTAAARATVLSMLPESSFVVGVVGRNQPRKRLDLTLRYFNEWIRTRHIEDAYLYLHIAPTGDRGVDIGRLIHYFGLTERVVVGTPEALGVGAPDAYMRLFYSAMDIYWTTTQGEGWGLPCLEAMACGVPCLVPGFGGLLSWAGDAAVQVRCREIVPSAPQNSLQYTLGRTPDLDATLEELDALYRSPVHREAYAIRGVRRASELTWTATGTSITGVLEAVASSKATGDAREVV